MFLHDNDAKNDSRVLTIHVIYLFSKNGNAKYHHLDANYLQVLSSKKSSEFCHLVERVKDQRLPVVTCQAFLWSLSGFCISLPTSSAPQLP